MAKNLIMDISHHQISSAIDWKKAAEEVALCIIRVQYGSKLIDREYKSHVANCKKYGIPFGHYAYGMFVSVEDAKIEARDFLNRMDKDALFLALDTEKDTVTSCGTNDVAKSSQAFIDVCKAAGHKVGFYVSHHLYKKYGLDKVKADFLWLPRYGKDNGNPDLKPDYPCDIWQYSQHCKVSWYPGGLDLNLLHGKKDLEWFIGKTPIKEVVKEVPKTEVKAASTTTKKRVAKNGTYTVVAGDTLSEISDDLKISVANLIKWNNIKNKNVISVGQVLKLKAPTKTAAKSKTSTTTYKIQSGDTLSKIATVYKTTVAELKKLNGYKSDTIYAGKTMKVPVNGAKTSTQKYDSYKIKSGDTLGHIAIKYHTSVAQLKKLNGLKSDTIYAGKSLKVPAK